MFYPIDPSRHLLDIPSLQPADIDHYLARAQHYRDALDKGKVDNTRLAGKTILNLFFEPSTRTRVSFEIAAHRLGANVVNWDPEGSSLKKGESFSDTIMTLSAMKPDAIVIRHSKYNTPHMVAQMVNCPVINAGDSWRAHPTQALIDALTIMQRKGHIGHLTVAICGDIAHSRVAACNISLLTRLGATVHLIAPTNFLPPTMPSENLRIFADMEEGLRGVDVVMMLRIQKERLDSAQMPDLPSYFQHYGLTQQRLAIAKPDAIVMHPGPLNRGIEIADDVADDPARSVILEQVANGVPTRMAVLDSLLSVAQV
jgi:aspartate carbamoyltransferase catalytic subunit